MGEHTHATKVLRRYLAAVVLLIPVFASVPQRATDVGPARLVAQTTSSLATGEVLGTFTWDLTCHGAAGFPCGVYEVVNTFGFAEGTLVNKALASLAPDGTKPGFFHVGIHPEGKSIVEGTGIFAGRTGTAHMSGRHGGQEFPAFVTFDDFWLIELDPK